MRQVYMPIVVPDEDFCFNFRTGTICDHYNEKSGYCVFKLGNSIEKEIGMEKPEYCKNLKSFLQVRLK